MTKKNSAAFTLIEMLVVIAIIATIAAFAVPALTSAMAKGQMTGTMNSARQLYLAGYQMALDGSTNSDANLAWPGDYASGVTNLQDYCTMLVQNDYLKVSDLPKLLSAPGATCTATSSTANNVTTVTLSGTSGLKVYPVRDADASNTIFAVSANYTYDTAFGANPPNPFGDKGFVVVRRGGDGSVLRKNNAAVSGSGAAAISAFEATVGKKPGEAAGTVTAGDPTGVLKHP
jgi:prepilin-type N-terminal cleavage/methylation domain-containing protein